MDLIKKRLLEERRELTENYRSTEFVWVKKYIREKIAEIVQELRKMILESTPIFHE